MLKPVPKLLITAHIQFSRLNKFLQGLSRKEILIIGGLLVPVLGTADLLTGPEIHFSLFYLIPLILITWYTGLLPGIMVALASVLILFFGQFLGTPFFSHPLIFSWNAVANLGFFMLIAVLLAELRKHQEHRRMLERIFFHDILNVATAIQGFAQLASESRGKETEELDIEILRGADRIVDEIEAQRTISMAESHELEPVISPVSSLNLLGQMVSWFRKQGPVGAQKLELAPDSEDIIFQSDEGLLFRVLGNMLKNALEATRRGETVTAGCRRIGGEVEFWVHNPEVIPDRDQIQIFSRSFSTKGLHRGLGTYSMKLLSGYLKGDVSFSSQPGEGTIFRARFPS